MIVIAEEEIVNDLIEAEHDLEDNLTKKKKKKKADDEKPTYNPYDALHARIRLRRGLLTLYCSLKVRLIRGIHQIE
jgi:hypothetical protein